MEKQANDWKTPELEEIPLNCEVASYASGETEPAASVTALPTQK